MVDISAEFKGVDEALNRLRTLAPALQDKGAKFAMSKGADLIRSKAIMNAKVIDSPDSEEQIWKNIVVRFSPRVFRRTGNVMFRVGVMGGAANYANTKDNVRSGKAGKSYKTAGDKTNPGGDTWYWRFVEFGSAKTKARPFMRPALLDQPEITLSVIQKSLNEYIDKQARKLQK